MLMELHKKIQLIEAQLANIKSGDDSKLEEIVQKLIRRVDSLEEDHNGFKEMATRKLHEIMEMLKEFITKKEFEEFKKQIAMDIENFIEGLLKKLLDKGEFNKWRSYFEREIKKLYQMFTGKKNNADDALLSKRPLGGYSCASCEKGLVNLEKFPPEYLVWGKFPKGDKLPKGGVGFSKIISLMRDTSQEKAQDAVIQQYSEREEDHKSIEIQNVVEPTAKIEIPNSSRPSTSQRKKSSHLATIKSVNKQ